MSNINFSIGSPDAHPYSGTIDQLSTQQQNDGPESNTAFPHTSGLNALDSARKISDLEETSATSVAALKLQALSFCTQARDLSGPRKLEKLNEAQAKLEAAIVLDPKHASALRFLGSVFLWQAELLSGPDQLTKFDEAQKKLEAAFAIDPNHFSSNFHSLVDRFIRQVATLFIQLKDLPDSSKLEKLNEAQAKIKAAIAIEPNNEDALFLLSVVLKA